MSDFVPTGFLKKEIDGGNIIRIRSAVVSYFLEDSSNGRGEIKKAIEYTEKKCREKGIELWQKHDETKFPINRNQAEWDENYYGLQLVYFDNNFSKERVEHVLKVGKHLYSKPEVSRSTASKQNEVKKKTTQFQKKIQNSPQKKSQTESPEKKHDAPDANTFNSRNRSHCSSSVISQQQSKPSNSEYSKSAHQSIEPDRENFHQQNDVSTQKENRQQILAKKKFDDKFSCKKRRFQNEKMEHQPTFDVVAKILRKLDRIDALLENKMKGSE